MEKHKTCSFFGHRNTELTSRLKQKLKRIIEDLIISDGVSTFLFGSRSKFNDLCHLFVTELKEKYPYIKRVFYSCKNETCVLELERPWYENLYSVFQKEPVRLLGVEEEFEHETKYSSGKAAYVERNQAMINDSDYCIFYYDKEYLPPKKHPKKHLGYYPSKSGTALAYTYASQKKKVLINLFDF